MRSSYGPGLLCCVLSSTLVAGCADEEASGGPASEASTETSESTESTESSDTGDETMDAASESTGDGDGDADVGMPARILAFHDADACPSTWSKHVPAEGRLLVGTTTASEVGITVGNALAAVELPTHSHDFLIDANIPNHSGITGLSSCCNETPAAATTVEPFG